MTQSRIFYNVHGDAPNFSLSLLWTHIKDLNPKWLLIMNATRAAIETAQRYPQTQVIMRSYAPADDDPLGSWGTWQKFLAHVKADLKSNLKPDETLPPNLWIYTNNESGDKDDLHDYLTGLISQPELKFVVGNYSVGTPQISRWKQLAPFLRLLDEQRHRAVLGAHEYFCAVPTTGFIGGPPTELKDEHGNVIHPDYTKRAHWPADVKGLTKWHCGRFEFLVAACKELGIRPPRVVLTEHGSDDLDDISAWADALPKTHPYAEIRGFRTLWNAWRSIENNPNLDVDKHFSDCLTYLDEHVYKDSIVEAQLVFSMFSKPQWAQFDISGTDVPHHLLEYARAQTPTPPPPVEPPPEPKPAKFKVGDSVIILPKFTPYGKVIDSRYDAQGETWEHRIEYGNENGGTTREWTWESDLSLEIETPPPAKEYTYGHKVVLRGTNPDELSALETYFRLQVQAAKDSILPSMKGVTEIKVINGE